MKVSLKKIEIFSIVFLYLAALFVWTLPLHNNKMPFGDVDASSHFTIGDYMATHDKSIAKVPYHIAFRYGGQNSVMQDYLWYAPQYWSNMAIGQIIGGDRIISFFLLVALFCSVIILSLYLLIRRLFGPLVAFLSSFLLIFSTRDYMIYLWGQWPQSLSFAFTPLALYCFYKYYIGRTNKEDKRVYIYILPLFLSAQFFFHPQGMMASIGALAIFSIILLIRDRKLPFGIIELSIAAVLLAIISALFAPFNVGEFFFEIGPSSDSSVKVSNVGELFKWYHGVKNDPGLPDFYFTYNKSHGSLDGSWISWWTLPLLLFGLLVLVYRRNTQDLLILSWFISFYFLTRMVVFGLGTRDMRMFAYEAHVFYPIIAIGVVSLSSFAKNDYLRKSLRFSFALVFILMAIFINGRSSYETLSGMQYSIGRINPWQYEAAEWVRLNTENEADVYNIGTLGFQNYAAKVKWLNVLSQRHFIVNDHELNMTDYVFLDYTDALLLKDQNYVNTLNTYEDSLQNASIVYNKNNIKVYKVANVQI